MKSSRLSGAMRLSCAFAQGSRSNFARLSNERAHRLGFASLSAPSPQSGGGAESNLDLDTKQKTTRVDGLLFWRRWRDLNSRAGYNRPTPLAGAPLRPLEYISMMQRITVSRFAYVIIHEKNRVVNTFRKNSQGKRRNLRFILLSARIFQGFVRWIPFSRKTCALWFFVLSVCSIVQQKVISYKRKMFFLLQFSLWQDIMNAEVAVKAGRLSFVLTEKRGFFMIYPIKLRVNGGRVTKETIVKGRENTLSRGLGGIGAQTAYRVMLSYYGDWASPQDCCYDEVRSSLTPGIFMSTGYHYFNAKLLSAQATVDTCKGDVSVRWESSYGETRLLVDIPAGTRASVVFAGTEYEATGGTSVYTAEGMNVS